MHGSIVAPSRGTYTCRGYSERLPPRRLGRVVLRWAEPNRPPATGERGEPPHTVVAPVKAPSSPRVLSVPVKAPGYGARASPPGRPGDFPHHTTLPPHSFARPRAPPPNLPISHDQLARPPRRRPPPGSSATPLGPRPRPRPPTSSPVRRPPGVSLPVKAPRSARPREKPPW